MGNEKLWVVTLTREVDVVVLAPTRDAAEKVAIKEAEDELAYGDTVTGSVVEMKRATAEDRDERPYGVAEHDTRTIGEILAGAPVPPTPEAMLAAWLAMPQPTTLDDVPAWICAAPRSSLAASADAWIGPLGERALYVTDGTGLLLIDEPAVQPPVSTRPMRNAAGVQKTIDDARSYAAWARSYDAAVIDAWSQFDGESASVAGVLVNPKLVQRWVVAAARITGGAIAVQGAGPLDPTVWSGPGWTALVMPLRAGRDGRRIEAFDRGSFAEVARG